MAATLAQSTSGRSERAGTSRILELDGLRALAILFVLGCHYPGFANLAWHIPEFGWIGVDIFFALSGYLITTILLGLRNRVTPYRTFYSRRFIRILPPESRPELPRLRRIHGCTHHWRVHRSRGINCPWSTYWPQIQTGWRCAHAAA